MIDIWSGEQSVKVWFFKLEEGLEKGVNEEWIEEDDEGIKDEEQKIKDQYFNSDLDNG